MKSSDESIRSRVSTISAAVRRALLLGDYFSRRAATAGQSPRRRRSATTVTVMVSPGKRAMVALTIIFLTTLFTLAVHGSARSSNEGQLRQNIARLAEDIGNAGERAELLEEEIQTTRQRLFQLAADYEKSYTKLAETKTSIMTSKRRIEKTEATLTKRQRILDKRLSNIYRHGQISLLDVILKAEDLHDFLVQLDFLALVEERDHAVLQSLSRLQEQQEADQARLEDQEVQERAFLHKIQAQKDEMEFYFEKEQALLITVEQELNSLQRQQAQRQKQLEEELAEQRLRALIEKGGGVSLSASIVFPVEGPHAYVDSWHAPRSGGRLHKGSDIFAPTGTPTVATRNGVVDRASFIERGLGGIAFWIIADDGNHYYYAHLASIAPGIANGSVVKAGQVVGYVGDTGNARTTPPHLHFGIYPGGAEPVNPYPYLVVADARN